MEDWLTFHIHWFSITNSDWSCTSWNNTGSSLEIFLHSHHSGESLSMRSLKMTLIWSSHNQIIPGLSSCSKKCVVAVARKAFNQILLRHHLVLVYLTCVLLKWGQNGAALENYLEASAGGSMRSYGHAIACPSNISASWAAWVTRSFCMQFIYKDLQRP